MARPAEVTADYKGEWIVTERSFSAKIGTNQFNWSVEAEVPAARYSVDDGPYELGPADWMPESGEVSVKLPDSTSKKSLAREAVVEIGGEMASHLAAEVLVHHAVVATAMAVDPTMTTAATITTGFVLYKSARLAASYIAAKMKARSGGKARPKRPPMPGWPAINFRGGKKAKLKATKKATSVTTGVRPIYDMEATASFEMEDGSVETLDAYGINIELIVDGKQAWATETLYVPFEDGTKIPAAVYAAVYAATLAKEAEAYHAEFIASRKSAAATTKSVGFYPSVSAAQSIGNRPCIVKLDDRQVVGRCDWYGYQGIVKNSAEIEVWRGPMRETPGLTGMVNGVSGPVVAPPGKSDSEAMATASADAKTQAAAMLTSMKKASFTMTESCPHCGCTCIDGQCPECSSERVLIGPDDMAQASAVKPVSHVNVSHNRWTTLV